MAQNEIGLKSLRDLFGMNFIIPSYQRGYRWEERQIIDLLNDILEFQKNKSEGEFYCLQPIIVQDKGNNKWEVIDGQQRLTTIFIILSYLKNALEILGLPTSLFSIAYETREKENYSSKVFLTHITEITKIDKTNIDFYRMSNAYLIIKKWFEDNKLYKGDFCSVLLKTDYDEAKQIDRANNIRFIWYINSTEETANVTFTKYNNGKIDLTNAELIKAIFYLSNKSMADREKKKYQLKIGYEWDDMENTLQKSDFWHFINPNKSNKKYPNHIEFIFDLVFSKYLEKIDNTKLKINKAIDKYWSFYVFNELISKNINIYENSKHENTRDFLWDEIKTYYRTFFEWYVDNCYFHLVGFLLQINNANIENVKKLSETNTKSQFEKELKSLIKTHFSFNSNNDFKELGYDNNQIKAKELLLLFNVITTMNSQYNRFAFDRYADEKWSLEHIHAQNSKELTTDPHRRKLLEEQKQYFQYKNESKLIEKFDKLLEMRKIDTTLFEEVQNEVFRKNSDELSIQSIKNLALLTVPDNSCLNNNIFPIKRDRIKELDEKGSFIPICTKNVFLKYYSKDVEQNVKWDKLDMENYFDEIKTVLRDYITIKEL
jgi:uncharacterized protein with ParB-like and HNH nuclease domain